MIRRRHLHLVDACTEPAESVAPGSASDHLQPEVVATGAIRQLPPIRPQRPSAAVRKCLRRAISGSAAMLKEVALADARFPDRSKRATDALREHGERILALADELRQALACEHRYRRWREGKRYDE